MQFTEQEAEMFKKARELQESWRPKRGDWFYKEDGLGMGTWLICGIRGATLWCAGEGMHNEAFKGRLVEFMAPQNYTWIPSVRDLMRVVESDRGASALGRLERLTTFIAANDKLQSNEWSFKQLLLLYVMRWQYSRAWQGNTWKKIAKAKSATIETG